MLPVSMTKMVVPLYYKKSVPNFGTLKICNRISPNRSQTISNLPSKVPLKVFFHSCQS